MEIKKILSTYKERTLTRDLTVMLSVTMLVVLAIVGALYFTISVNQAENALQDTANNNADNLADVLSLPLWQLDSDSIEQISDAYMQSENIVAVRVIDDQGELLYQTGTSEENAITETRPITFQGRELGQIEIFVSTQSISTLRENILLSLLAVFLLIVGTVIVVTRILLNRFLGEPLEDLTQGINRIASGNYDHRMEPVNLADIQSINDQINFMAAQIQERDRTLEKQVSARTHDLQVAVDVSRQITTELDIDKLLHQIVWLTTQRFKLYACFVFEYDENEEALKQLAGINSEGDKVGIHDNISIHAEPSIMARAAQTRKAVTVNNVDKSDLYMAHDLLPETRSELAIPLILGDDLIGIFDIQSRVPSRFSNEDLRILTALAEQVTIAIRNAQLFTDAENARQEAETANYVKSQFLANMSHELRTPLNAILNYTGFVADGDLGPVNEKQQDVLLRAISSSEHLLNLINDILDMTKIEVGMMRLFIRDINMKEVLKSSCAVASGLLKDKSVILVEEIPDDLPNIMGDKRRLHQVFLNILSNASKFTSDGSITVSAEHTDENIVISVKDTGIGIPEDQQTLVFEHFQQADHDFDTGGTGLGMPITKHFVEAHDGKIWFESEVGKGTTFFVELPIVHALESEQA